MNPTRTLVLAWGNPGRRDDGLGPAFAARLEGLGLAGIEVESDYQLQVEHAAALAGCDRVVFVDASRGGAEPCSLERIAPAPAALRYTSHEMSPAAVLALGEELCGVRPEGWILGIRGYEFDDFDEEMSPGACANLERTLVRFTQTFMDPRSPGGEVRTSPGRLDQREGEA